MNLTGNWKYSEDFGAGNSVGEVVLLQKDEMLYAEFNFVEQIDGDYRIEVFEKLHGEIKENKVLLESIEVIARNSEGEIKYMPNSFDVHIVSENKLVGSSFDADNVCGVFTMERILSV